jgi:S1-C subfamily serine protease
VRPATPSAADHSGVFRAALRSKECSREKGVWGEPGIRIVGIFFSVSVAAIISGAAPVQAADTFSGSGVVISTRGEILTNAHVVESCSDITVRFSAGNLERAWLVARDQRNDLAVIRADSTKTNKAPASFALFREGAPIRAGDVVVALGYPLSGLLATTANLTVGNVSALAGLGDDSRYMQISAAVQPGNSGGPLLDASGHLVGIVTSKLNAANVARVTGDIPQNVNFALKAEVARTFLDSKDISYQTDRSNRQLSPADVGDMARPFTVYIECQQAALRSAAVPPSPTPVTPSGPPRPSGASPSPCLAEFGKLREEVQKRGAAAKAAGEHKVAREEMCKLVQNFSAAEGKWLKFTEAGVASCGIPPEVVTQLKRVHARTEQAQKNICSGE